MVIGGGEILWAEGSLMFVVIGLRVYTFWTHPSQERDGTSPADARMMLPHVRNGGHLSLQSLANH